MVSDETDDNAAGDEPTYSGYRPRSGQVDARTRRAADRAASARTRGARRTVAVGVATAAAVATFLVGLTIGWMARGGPPSAQLIETTQTVPAVTVTREVAP